MFGRYDSLTKILVNEILRCVYDDYEAVRASNSGRALNARVLYSCTPYFELHSADRLLIHNLKEELADHEETLENTQDIEKKLDVIFERQNKMMLRTMVRAWAQVCRAAALAHARHSRKRMQKWFSLWRLNHEEVKKHGEEAVAQAAALQRRIANEMMLATLVAEQEELMEEVEKIQADPRLSRVAKAEAMKRLEGRGKTHHERMRVLQEEYGTTFILINSVLAAKEAATESKRAKARRHMSSEASSQAKDEM